MPPGPLPIDAWLPEIRAALDRGRNLVVVAPPGAGKTTRVPPLLLDALPASAPQVIVLQPRRLAARTTAARIAAERGGPLGGEVGYAVRFERRAGPRTRLLVVTEGLLLRRLEEDPFLEGVGAVVLDELHERTLDLDLSLALTRRIQSEVRPDLRLVAMSATLEPGPVAAYLGGAPVVEAPGRPYPVELRYRPLSSPREAEAGVVRAVEEALSAQPRSVLVFLPGQREIGRAAAALAGRAALAGVRVLPLHGELPPARQDEALAPGDGRRVILATNVAETSLTIEGVGAVVDLGLMRTPQHDAASGLERLATVRAPRASADQRAGRAGRLGPGLCLRLWSEAQQRSLPPFARPEIQRRGLSGAALRLLAFGERDLEAFPWFEAPPAGALAAALSLLDRLGARREGRLTPLGRRLARLPLEPRLGRVVLEGEGLGVGRRAALAAALLSQRDVLPRGAGGSLTRRDRESDLLLRVEAVERLASRDAGAGALHRERAHAALRAREQLARDLPPDRLHGEQADEALLRALLAGFPDRVALRRAPGSREALLLGGRGVRLSEDSSVRDAAWFLVLEAEAADGRDRGQALVTQASALEPEWLDAERLVTEDVTGFDASLGRVVARRVTRYDDLVVRSVTTGQVDAAAAAQALEEAARADLGRALDAERPAVAQWLARARCLSAWRPDLGLPAFDEAWVAGTLPVLCAGLRSFDELRRAPLPSLWEGLLSYEQRQALERLAPERIEVPSGSRIALRYEAGRPPVLAARIQELFGLAETPRVAGGRVPVLLHLLAPSGRPQQVTDDLASFWNVAYHEVRRELRARYPRHAWPEDPWNAQAQRRPRRRG